MQVMRDNYTITLNSVANCNQHLIKTATQFLHPRYKVHYKIIRWYSKTLDLSGNYAIGSKNVWVKLAKNRVSNLSDFRFWQSNRLR
jgi:hypothetical protein